jgi:hypothetical protein
MNVAIEIALPNIESGLSVDSHLHTQGKNVGVDIGRNKL